MALAGPSNAFWLIPVLMFLTGCSFGFAMAPSLAANMAKISAGRDRARVHAAEHGAPGRGGGRGRAARHRARGVRGGAA